MSSTFFFNPGPNNPAFSQEVIVRAFDPVRPFPQNPSAIIYRARLQQLRAYYTRPAFNTPHPNLPQVYFADDIDFQDRTSGMVEWTRIWVTIPNSWNDFTSDAYTFPGITFSAFTLGRVPVTKTVTSKILMDYYLVGTLPNYDSANYDNVNSWYNAGINLTPNATAIPVCAGGTNVATKLVGNTNSNGSPVVSTSSSVNGAKPISVFVKNENVNVVRLSLLSGNDVSQYNYSLCYVTADLRTGQPVEYVNCQPVIAAIGEGWWRLGMTDPVASVTTAALGLAMCTDEGSFIGNFFNKAFYAWRGMIPNAATLSVLPTPTVPPTTTPDGTNYPVQQADLIQVKFGLNYVYAFQGNYVAEYLSGSTTPNVNTYQGWVATDQNTPNSYSIESTDSTLQLWQGTVWQRTRNFVKAR